MFVAIHGKTSGTPDSTATQVMVNFVRTEAEHIEHGTIRAIWTTTDLHWFLTVVTLTISPATTMCIAQDIGTDTDIDRSIRLSAGCRQAILGLSSATTKATRAAGTCGALRKT